MNLEKELETLKKITGTGMDLRLQWLPLEEPEKHGEVKGETIFIYNKDEEMAFRTLRHEFFDYMISKNIVDPLVMYINIQKSLIDKLIYERKEFIVEKLVDLLPEKKKPRES